MKLLILGASGLTGQHLVSQALSKGHEVTALVRDPAKLNIIHERLRMLTGDALDKEAVTKALEGMDAVISVLGVGKSLKSNNLITNAVSLLLPAMETKGIKRLIFFSALGVGDTFKKCTLLQKIAFRIFLRDIYADKGRADEMIKNSNLHWTIVCPVVLTDKPYTGKYTAGESLKMFGMPTVSRADTADFTLHQLFDNTYLRKIVLVKG